MSSCENDFCECLVFEKMDVDLCDLIMEHGNVTEATGIVITRQIMKGCKYLHDKDILHRDIKTDNILCKFRGRGIRIVIADFGFSIQTKGPVSAEYPGTPLYAAPELVKTVPYTQAIDLWAIGIITFCILTAHFPFSVEEISRFRTWVHPVRLPEQLILSNNANNFVESLLKPVAEERLTAKSALEHPWIYLTKENISFNDS